MVNRNDLRAKAMAATHGPWIAGRTDIVIADSKGSKGMVICSLEQCLDRRTNSDYIASASPDVILALLDQLEEYEEALKKISPLNSEGPYQAILAPGIAQQALAKYQVQSC